MGSSETASNGGGRPDGGSGQAPAGAPRAGFALLVTLSMAQFMVVLDFTIVNVALPSIQHGLHVATTTLQWLVSAYAVAFGGFLLLGGRLADAYGRARLYRIGLATFVVASVAGGLAVEPGLLITSRVIQGIGAAMLAPAGLSLLVTAYPGEQERSRALGTYGAIVSTGFASGAVLGGLLAEVTWRLVFFVNVPIGIALLAAVGAYSAGQVLLVTLYLQEGRALSPALTGLCFVPQAAGSFALSGPAGRLVPTLGPRRALAIALATSLLALCGSALAVLAGSLPALLGTQFVLGVAARLSQVSSTLAGTHGPVAARSEGTASALLTATRQCGSALGVAIVSSTLVALHGSFTHRTAVAMFVAAGFAFAGLFATRVVPPGPPLPQVPQPQYLFRHHAGGMPLGPHRSMGCRGMISVVISSAWTSGKVARMLAVSSSSAASSMSTAPGRPGVQAPVRVPSAASSRSFSFSNGTSRVNSSGSPPGAGRQMTRNCMAVRAGSPTRSNAGTPRPCRPARRRHRAWCRCGVVRGSPRRVPGRRPSTTGRTRTTSTCGRARGTAA
jgi:MFS family permease